MTSPSHIADQSHDALLIARAIVAALRRTVLACPTPATERQLCLAIRAETRIEELHRALMAAAADQMETQDEI